MGMTREDYEQLIDRWCADVKAEAIRLFESGTLPQETTGLAINIVESRRKHETAKRAELLPERARPFRH